MTQKRLRYKYSNNSVDINTYEHLLKPHFRFTYNTETHELTTWVKLGKFTRTLHRLPEKADKIKVFLSGEGLFTKGSSLYDKLDDIYKRLHTNIKLYPYGRNPRKAAEPLYKVLPKIFLDGATQNSLMVDTNDIHPFTANKLDYNLAFFDPATLDDMERVEPVDWFGFESQIPEELKPVFRAFVYSIFVPSNRGRQILVLQDTGQTGKSTILNALQTFLNEKIRYNLATSMSQGSLDDKFWGSKVYDKRLIVFGDSANEYLVKKDKIKQLTGGDYIPVEYKGQSTFSFKPNVKVIVATNTPIEISNLKESEWSRAILIPLGEQDPEYKKKYIHVADDGEQTIIGHKNSEKWFLEQLPSYLLVCKPSYEKLCPTGANIILPKGYKEKYIKGSTSSMEVSDFETLYDEYIEITEKEEDFLPSRDVISVIDLLKEKGIIDEDFKYKTDFYTPSLKLNPKIKSKHRSNIRGFQGLKWKKGIKVLDNGKIVLG